MSSKVTIRKAQDHLSDLLARAEQSGERFVVERNGKPVGAIVSIADLHQVERLGAGNGSTARPKTRAEREKLARKLGRRFTLPPDKSRRLRELIEREDDEARLTVEEKRELKRLLKEHEELVVKRAQALDQLE